MRALRDAGRTAALAAVGLVLAATAWVCLVGGAVLLLGRVLGLGPALLAVGAGFVLLLGVIGLVAGAVRSPAPPRSASQAPGPDLVPKVLAALSQPGVPRAGLVLIGLALIVLAALLPGRGGAKEPPS